jgi:hypothetical protein
MGVEQNVGINVTRQNRTCTEMRPRKSYRALAPAGEDKPGQLPHPLRIFGKKLKLIKMFLNYFLIRITLVRSANIVLNGFICH